MENNTTTQITADQLYGYAAGLLMRQNMNSYEVQTALMERGLDQQTAATMVETLETQIADAKRKKANKDMIFGALWCVGGIVLTVASIGYIFWGAIVFGGYQFIRGAMNRD